MGQAGSMLDDPLNMDTQSQTDSKINEMIYKLYGKDPKPDLPIPLENFIQNRLNQINEGLKIEDETERD